MVGMGRVAVVECIRPGSAIWAELRRNLACMEGWKFEGNRVVVRNCLEDLEGQSLIAEVDGLPLPDLNRVHFAAVYQVPFPVH